MNDEQNKTQNDNNKHESFDDDQMAMEYEFDQEAEQMQGKLATD